MNLIRVPNVTRQTIISEAVAAFYSVWPASERTAKIADLADGGFAIQFDPNGMERPVLGMNLAINGFVCSHDPEPEFRRRRKARR